MKRVKKHHRTILPLSFCFFCPLCIEQKEDPNQTKPTNQRHPTHLDDGILLKAQLLFGRCPEFVQTLGLHAQIKNKVSNKAQTLMKHLSRLNAIPLFRYLGGFSWKAHSVSTRSPGRDCMPRLRKKSTCLYCGPRERKKQQQPRYK